MARAALARRGARPEGRARRRGDRRSPAGRSSAILVNQRLARAAACLLSLRDVPGLDGIDGATASCGSARWRGTARSSARRSCATAGRRSRDAFALVASPRVRNQATVGGVLADADYASDPPAMLCALGARAVARSAGGEREIPVEELIIGYYETSLAPDELIVEVACRAPTRAVYRKFRSRSHEDRPCVSVAAARRRGGAARRRRRGRRPAAALPRDLRLAATAGPTRARGRDRPPLRGGDRADRRRARLGRLPPAGDRRRGAPRARGARA